MGMKVGRGSFVNSCIALVLSKRGLLGTVDHKKNPRAQSSPLNTGVARLTNILRLPPLTLDHVPR